MNLFGVWPALAGLYFTASFGLTCSGLVFFSFSSSASAQSTTPSGVTLPPGTPERVEQSTPPAPTPPLPVEQPIPAPTPNLEAPVTPPLDMPLPSLQFPVREVQVSGSTVLQPQISELVSQFTEAHSTASFEDLVVLRSAITQLYIRNGYVTSGAFLLNNQDLTNGVVKIQVVEGTLEDIQIKGLNHLRQAYVRDRLQFNDQPLSQPELEKALQLLQLNPLIRRVNAELTAGSAPGRNILIVEVKEASPFRAGIGGDNYQSPSIGSEQLSVQASYDNLLGMGDRINAGYGLTDGLDSFNVGYAIPLNAHDGTLSLNYSNDDSLIIESDFRRLDIRSRSETFSVAFRQPIEKTPVTEVGLSLGADLRRSTTFLEGEPYSFSEGTEDGRSNVSVIRFSQDWVNRSNPNTVLAARSQFSLGIDALNATVNDTGTDGRFFAWLGQFQWVQRLAPRVILISRLNAQLTPDSLLPLERFGFGGVETVRGYRQNQLVTDNGILGAVETRIALLPDSDRLQLIPFAEVGHGWNNRLTDPPQDTLASVGLGLRWAIAPELSIRIDYGIPLINVPSQGNSLQDNGLYFSVRYEPF